MEPPGVTRSLVAIGLVAASCLVAGCQAPSASTAPNPSPSSVAASTSPTPTAGATRSPATGPGGLFHVVGSAPVLAQSIFADRNAILPGAVTPAADGTYHAWVVAFAKAPGVQDIHHLTSADAISWTDRADPSLAALSTGLGRPGALPTSVLETSSGWVMYFVGTLASEDRGWDIWRATAPGPGGPWTRSDGPVFRRGAAGSWDAGALDFPTVIATDTGYSMFYSAIPTLESAEGSVGLATSTDGIAWTRHDDPATTASPFARSDPVATAGLCGGFDDRAVEQPRVISGPNGLYLVYAGYAGDLGSRASVGFASSLDGGLTWACQWPASVLDAAELPAGDGVHTVNAFMRGERVALLIEWLRNGGSEDWLVHLGPRQP
jgi:hypothetical protein